MTTETPTETETTRVVQLDIENFKRIRAVSIKPDGAVVQITGRNGQGKTSVLDAIEAALAGKRANPTEPIRRGEEQAKVVVDLGTIIVERTWNAKGNTYLKVRPKDKSATFTSPQQVLDELYGRLTFDPLEFTRMNPGEQIKTLKDVAGLDFTALDEERAEAYAERTSVNRDLKQAESALKALPDKCPDVPAEPVSIKALTEEHQNALREKQRQDNARQELSNLDAAFQQHTADVEDTRRHLQELERKGESLTQAIHEKTAEIATFEAPPVDAILNQISQAEDTNRRVQINKDREAATLRLQGVTTESNRLTRRIQEIDDRKAKLLAEAEMPVEGLSFNDDGVLFGGIPFNQASSAEQLRVSVAMGIALNPRLRLMCIRDGSLLDGDSLQLLEAEAEKHNAQILIERVANKGEGVGVIIEDGSVVETGGVE